MTDLTEEVARAICKAAGRSPDYVTMGTGGVSYGPDGSVAVTSEVHQRAWQQHIGQAQAAIAIVLERAAGVCGDQAKVFLSPEYATGQPLSSTQERFACMRCAEEILALSQCSEAKI